MKITSPVPRHIRTLAPNVKAIDLLEMSATNKEGLSTSELLHKYVLMSDVSYSFLSEDGRCLGLGGMAESPEYEQSYTPWLILSEELTSKHGKQLHKSCKEYLKSLPKGTFLYNLVSTENGQCVVWLKRLGFQVNMNTNITIGGIRFYLFTTRIE